LELRKSIWHARITVRRLGKPVAREWYSLDTADHATAQRRVARLVQEIDAGRRAESAIVVASAPDTIAGYASAEGKRLADCDRKNLVNYVVPALGPMPLADVRAANVKAVRDAAIAKGLFTRFAELSIPRSPAPGSTFSARCALPVTRMRGRTCGT